MKYRTLIHTPEVPTELQQALLQLSPGEFLNAPGHSRFLHHHLLEKQDLAPLCEHYQIDINPLPVNYNPLAIGLVLSDMDSTFISIECIDEIADFLGIKPQIAAITQAAMNGELDFQQALLQRVALLKNTPETVLQQVYEQRVKVSEGVDEMLAFLRERNIKTALVSGGFTYFTNRLQQRYKLDYTLANTLEIEEGKLTGQLTSDIVDGDAKAEFLLHSCAHLKMNPVQTVVIGDGANDIAMFSLAGLSIAYRGKPAVQQAADAILNYSSLAAVADFLSI